MTWNPHQSYVVDGQSDLDFYNQGGLMPNHFTRHKIFQTFEDLPIWKQCGYFCDDSMTPIQMETFDVAMQSANNGYWASNNIDKCKHNLIYCLNTYPGHHAMSDGYGGYCFLNNCAIVASNLINNYGKKVVVLDIDYHCGNAIPDIFDIDNEQILMISIHADSRFEYPSFSGFTKENTTNNHNIIFPKKATWTEYSECLGEALCLINKFDPDVIILAFGADTLIDDPDASILYGCALQVDDYKKIGKIIGQLNKPTIVMQEGGYSLDYIPAIVENLLCGLSNH